MTFESLLQQIKFHKEEIKKLRELIKEIQPNSYYWMNKPILNEYAAIYYQKNAEKIKKRRKERYYEDLDKSRAKLKVYYKNHKERLKNQQEKTYDQS